MVILFYAIIHYRMLSISLNTLCGKTPESFRQELQETHVVGISIVDKHFSQETEYR